MTSWSNIWGPCILGSTHTSWVFLKCTLKFHKGNHLNFTVTDFKIDNTRNSKTWISGLNSISSSPANRRTFTFLSFLQHLLASIPSAPAANRSSSNCSPWRLKKQKKCESKKTSIISNWKNLWTCMYLAILLVTFLDQLFWMVKWRFRGCL